MTSNAQTLKNAKNILRPIKEAQIMAAMNETALRLIEDALSRRRGWLGFTGNLPTSYSAGVWDFKGNLEIFYAEDVDSTFSLSSVIRAKVGKGEGATLAYPWEGEARGVLGQVDLHTRYGVQLVQQFLGSYKPDKLPCIVVCTGAEYSQYIEKKGDNNVLSESADKEIVKRIADKIFTIQKIV